MAAPMEAAGSDGASVPDTGAASVGSVVVAGPVVVSLIDRSVHGEDATAGTTFAIGSLEVTLADEAAATSAAAGANMLVVSSDWAAPLPRGLRVLQDDDVFVLTMPSGNQFALTLPPNVPEDERLTWLGLLESSGCVVEPGKVAPGLHKVALYFGNELDKCGADEFAFADRHVPKGDSLCSQVTLDNAGYFYWVGGGGKRERTRPRWKETNFVTCRRAPTRRRITWECYHVPMKGEAAGEARAAIEAEKAAAKARAAELWAARKKRASNFTASGLRLVTSVVSKGAGVALPASAAPAALMDGADGGASSDDEVSAAAEQAAVVGKEAFVKASKALVAIAINGYPRALRTTRSKRNEILRACGGDSELALKKVLEEGRGFVDEAKKFLLYLVPYVGIPASLVYPLWEHLRWVSLAAGIYGHDLQSEEIQAKILLAAGGMEAGVHGIPPSLDFAAQKLWVACVGPVMKLVPVGKLVGALTDVEGNMRSVVTRTFGGGPGVPEEEYSLVLDTAPTINDRLQLINDIGVQTLEQAVLAGAKRAGVQEAEALGAKAAAMKAAGAMAKQAGTAALSKAQKAMGPRKSADASHDAA